MQRGQELLFDKVHIGLGVEENHYSSVALGKALDGCFEPQCAAQKADICKTEDKSCDEDHTRANARKQTRDNELITRIFSNRSVFVLGFYQTVHVKP
jgi:hypothetical protein